MIIVLAESEKKQCHFHCWSSASSYPDLSKPQKQSRQQRISGRSPGKVRLESSFEPVRADRRLRFRSWTSRWIEKNLEQVERFLTLLAKRMATQGSRFQTCSDTFVWLQLRLGREA